MRLRLWPGRETAAGLDATDVISKCVEDDKRLERKKKIKKHKILETKMDLFAKRPCQGEHKSILFSFIFCI